MGLKGQKYKNWDENIKNEIIDLLNNHNNQDLPYFDIYNKF